VIARCLATIDQSLNIDALCVQSEKLSCGVIVFSFSIQMLNGDRDQVNQIVYCLFLHFRWLKTGRAVVCGDKISSK